MTGGRVGATLRRLVVDGRLEQVPVSPALAERLMDEARAHLRAAAAIREIDPPGSFHLAYDAARKAGSALLALEGLRATSRGGHLAVQEAVEALDGSFTAFSRMRRRRHDSEYPGPATPTLTADDAGEGVAQAADMVRAAGRWLASGSL